MKKLLLTVTALVLVPGVCFAASFKLGTGTSAGISNTNTFKSNQASSAGKQLKEEPKDTTPAIPEDDAFKNCSVWIAPYGYNWNANGAHTIPANIYCWEGYGAYATITVNGNPTYRKVGIRFWDSASTIKGSFTTQTLGTTGNTSYYLKTLNPTYTFTDPVTITDEVVLQQADDNGGGKGIKLVFQGGLKGSPKCTLQHCWEDFTGCPYASCSKCQVSTTKVCTCTTAGCQISGNVGSGGGSGYSNKCSGTSASTCPTGCAWRTLRSDGWEAGCYKIGNCNTVRPDLVGGTCMFVEAATGNGQCKTDNIWSGSVCSVK